MENSGIILVDKPSGITSRKVVDLFQKKLRIKKIGHAGTLDPLASGLLILLINKATKLSGAFSSSDKIYKFTICFGMQTDTDDLEGEIIKQIETAEPDKKFIFDILSSFRGTIEQKPPQFSAVKHRGQRAYKLARKGIEVTLKSRSVVIHNLAVLNWDWPKITLIARVSSGTYIRSLIRDIGNLTGFGATAESIRRLSIGNNFVDHAVDIDQQNPPYQNPESCLSHLDSISLNDINIEHNKFKLNLCFKDKFLIAEDDIKYCIARRQNDGYYKIIYSGMKL